MGNGFIFIWTEKELTPHVIKMGHKWGFRYVENLAWIKLNNDNTIARQKYKYVSKSRCTCLILRREMVCILEFSKSYLLDPHHYHVKCQSDGEDIELKHQRNADCVFDFIKNRKEGKRLAPALPIKLSHLFISRGSRRGKTWVHI